MERQPVEPRDRIAGRAGPGAHRVQSRWQGKRCQVARPVVGRASPRFPKPGSCAASAGGCKASRTASAGAGKGRLAGGAAVVSERKGGGKGGGDNSWTPWS